MKSVVEDRWWPFIKTKIPKPIQVSFYRPQSLLIKPSAMFGIWKVPGKGKRMLMENDFLMFDYTVENIKENQIFTYF